MHRRFILFSSILLLLLTSCTTEALKGKNFTGQSYIGLSSEDLYSENNKNKKESLIFSEGKAKISNKEFFYYDSPITEKNFTELRPFLYKIVLSELGDENPESEEANETVRRLFDELKNPNSMCFVLSNKELQTISVNLDTEEFNFKGYVGLGYDGGDGFLIYLISTKDIKKGYVFG